MATVTQTETRVLDAFRRWGYLEAELDPLGRLTPARHPELTELGSGPEVAAARAAYCGSLAVEFAHIADPARRAWIAERMESPSPAGVDRERALDQILRAELFEQAIQGSYIGSKRFSVEGLAALIPLLGGTLDVAGDLGAEQAMIAMSHRGRLTAMTQIVGRTPLEIFAAFEDVDPRAVPRLGRRQVPPRCDRYLDDTLGQTPAPPPELQSEPPRGGFVGRDGADPGEAHPARRHQREEDPAAPDPRRLGVRRPGDRRRNAQPSRDRRLLGRRRAADRGQQPDRLHHRAARLQLDPLLDRHRAPAAGADLPRQRRGARRRAARGANGRRVSLRLRERCRDRPRRIPQVRPQRGRRPDRHPAAALQEDPADAAALEELCAADRHRRKRHRRTGRELQARARRGEAGEREAREGARAARAALLLVALPRRLLRSVGRGRHRPARGRPRSPRRGGDRGARRLPRPPQGREAPRRAAPDGRGGEERRLRHGGGARFRLPARRRHPRPPLRTGHAARHLQPPPRRADRHRERERDGAARGVRLSDRKRSVLRGLRLDPLRSRGDGVRVRILARLSGGARPLGGAVRRLRQRRADHHRPVPRRRRGQVAAAVGARAPPAARLRRTGAGAFVGAPRALSSALRRGQPAGLPAVERRAVLPPAAKAGAARLEKAADRDDAEVDAAHPDACSPLADFAKPRFENILPDSEVGSARKILLASGKILHELRAERKRRAGSANPATDVAIVGLEQLYPFPEKELIAELERHPGAREVLWVQEEPANMGAFFFVDPILDRVAKGRSVRSVKRSASASPATGSPKAHALEQKTLLQLAFA